ncbi:hypothetical protein GTP46_06815 [Duganella sp. FT135W]|uniref:DUF2946 domain-containing protein n=1 Tax=Duganella flavida TaxID=2692175 RepID=A0A6L8K550_9BURK|nr:hypothetical protein [Duganella flavida]MYM22350.1 hypothetical protein [Duganella flavida]
MLRRTPFVHVFLALLLLLTQQVGVTHVYSHWSGIEQQNLVLTDEDHAEHRKRVAVHKVCAECVSVAQMAAAITSSPLTLAISTLSTGPVHLPATLAACERTTCVFQSRAPPLA